VTTTTANPVEVVGHDGLDGTERVIVDSERLTRTGEDALFLARYLSSGNDAGAPAYGPDAGGWTFVRDTVTGSNLAQFIDGRPAGKDDYDYAAGRADGEAWARKTGSTSDDLRMVPVVKGSRLYKTGHRLGVAKVRRERYLAEQGIEPA